MKSILTIVCKLNPSKEVVKKIDTTWEMFAAACNYANQTVKPTITSKTTIQSEVYQRLIERLRGAPYPSDRLIQTSGLLLEQFYLKLKQNRTKS